MSYPPFGTRDIKCAKRGCGWIGKETDRIVHPDDAGKFAVRKVCPKCHCDSYSFLRGKGESRGRAL